jgi:hypothetical protein
MHIQIIVKKNLLRKKERGKKKEKTEKINTTQIKD